MCILGYCYTTTEEQECLKLYMGLGDDLTEDVVYNKGKPDESLSNTNKSHRARKDSLQWYTTYKLPCTR